MAYKFVNADQLDADLTTVANAIRAKGNTSEQLVFPSGMVSAISAISTGVELNFEVVGNPQPANPKDNTIWLNTDVDITGYYFQAEQPEMQPGEVWISTGTASQVAFNALKKGTLMVCTISAKQMADGELVARTAKIWQDGQWVEFDQYTYIIKDGVFVADSEAGGMSSSVPGGIGHFKSDNGKLTYSMAHNDNGTQECLCTKKPIDVTNITTVCMDVESLSGGEWYILVNKTRPQHVYNNQSDFPATVRISKAGTVNLDVSALSGNYYIGVATWEYQNITRTMEIANLKYK